MKTEIGMANGRPHLRWAALGMAGLLLAGCGGQSQVHPVTEGITDRAVLGYDTVNGPGVIRVLWQDGYQFVRIDTTDAKAAPAAEAGASLGITVGGMRKALGAIRFAKGGGDPIPAFASDEADQLAEPMAKALAAAQPGQDVAFAIQHTGGLALFGQKSMTAGRAFAANGALNIIFGTVRAPYSGQLIATGMPPTIRTGARDKQIEVDYAVIPDGLISRGRPDRGDWAKVEPAAWSVASAASTPTASAVTARDPRGPAAAPVPDVRDPLEIERRLEVLQHLLQKHLITEDEYARHKAEILDRL